MSVELAGELPATSEERNDLLRMARSLRVKELQADDQWLCVRGRSEQVSS